MAEFSTIARPYAQGLWKALTEQGKTGESEAIELKLNALSSVLQEPAVRQFLADPKLTVGQIYDLLIETLGADVSAELKGLLRAVVENGRLEVLPEIVTQFRALKNESEGVADAYIETAYALADSEVASLIERLQNRFPGKKLNPIVKLNPDLIGGVSIQVGDQVLDGSVRSRLAQMKTALTA